MCYHRVVIVYRYPNVVLFKGACAMKNRKFLLLLLIPLLVVLVGCSAAPASAPEEVAAAPADLPPTTADHSQFAELKKAFKTGPEVTEACLECHNEAPAQIMANIHWTWEYKDPASGEVWGKKGVINSF